jgi:hypothetical protein
VSPGSCLHWIEDGNAFVIASTNDLERDLLPAAFRLNRLGEFLELLRQHGFQYALVTVTAYVVRHPLFRRSEPHLLHEIQRQPVPTAGGDGSLISQDNALELLNYLRQKQIQYQQERREQIQELDDIIHESIFPTLQWMQSMAQAVNVQMQEYHRK